MSERLKNIEADPNQYEDSQEAEVKPVPAELNKETKSEALQVDKAREVRELRERVNEIQESPVEQPAAQSRSDDNSPQVRIPSLEPLTDRVTKTFTAIRTNLTPSQARFSKVIHNSVVSSVSEATARTLARPYAILAGSLVAFLGSGVYMYYSRHLGYKYNFFVPILLFFLGLIAGLIVEFIYKLIHGHRKNETLSSSK